ncbi:glyoxalase [Longispora fulva]|uniref:Catechol 2,3-dioxygenase-like lactoylglutathione lyase family enzyme n=1 Tax=Longispora fulva TaxID=619741 RepID=A0A8J7KG19_9ACTN|nr:VOC family protein [Longispora fulva]MBG6136860.1 catechol 2,3-dioxygenase-like lactoylglutathione lyase family enzyme [Longispora fulva]GIG60031.1 glyoxalase [Longispora fulva]
MTITGRGVATLPASDIERAKSWYAEILGLKPAMETEQGLLYDLKAGTKVLLFPSTGRASGTHTQVAFEVDDLEAEVRGMKAHGVVFEDYDMPGFKTENSILSDGDTRSAWLHDSEGNLISISTPLPY